MSNKIGIIGLGFVGSAIFKSFTLKKMSVLGYDKYQSKYNKFEVILDTDIVFLALPTSYLKKEKEFDKSALNEVCHKLKNNNYKGLVIIKSTVEPGTSQNLAEKYDLKIIHNPEFLTARTAFNDFHNQTHIVLGPSANCTPEDTLIIKKFYIKNWPKANISVATSTETETTKIACNTFYALKIQFFNELFFMCTKDGSNYEKVKEMMIKNNWINPMHTNVPGPDGQFSYGGACFPKDTNAILQHMKKNDIPHSLVAACIKERNQIRGTNEKKTELNLTD